MVRPWTDQRSRTTNKANRETAEILREAFLEMLRPDIVLITSLFEGFGDSAVTSIGLLNPALPHAVILYDLIPLINPDDHFKNESGIPSILPIESYRT